MSDEDKSVIGRLPPPCETDVLFGPGEDSQTNACVNYSHDEGWVYLAGFRRAGLLLAEHVCESGSDQDVLVYPIMYLYRHHAELVLKSLIETSAALLSLELSKSDRNSMDGSHKLSDLWEIAKPLLNPVCALVDNPPFPEADLKGIDSYIRQIHEHDPDGQRFRYATAKVKRAGSRKGPAARVPSLRQDLRLINIRAFAIAMEKFANYLEGIDSWFGDLHQYHLDMRAEMARDAHG